MLPALRTDCAPAKTIFFTGCRSWTIIQKEPCFWMVTRQKKNKKNTVMHVTIGRGSGNGICARVGWGWCQCRGVGEPPVAEDAPRWWSSDNQATTTNNSDGDGRHGACGAGAVPDSCTACRSSRPLRGGPVRTSVTGDAPRSPVHRGTGTARPRGWMSHPYCRCFTTPRSNGLVPPRTMLETSVAKPRTPNVVGGARSPDAPQPPPCAVEGKLLRAQRTAFWVSRTAAARTREVRAAWHRGTDGQRPSGTA